MRNSISYHLTVSYLSFQGGLFGGTCLVFQGCSLAPELPQGSTRVYGRWVMFLCGVGEAGKVTDLQSQSHVLHSGSWKNVGKSG